MSVQLNDFTDTKWIDVGNECKKLESWMFKNESFCVPGECNPDLLLMFEDGTRKYAHEIPNLRNCNDDSDVEGRQS